MASIFMASAALADPLAEQGWFFYKDPPQQKIESQPDTQENPEQFNSYKQLLNQARVEYEEAQAKAIVNPTQENIAAYRAATKVIIDQSARFAMLTGTQYWQDPDSGLAQQATGGKGLSQDISNMQEQNEEIVRKYGIFYFFASNCKYCSVEADELKRMEVQYGITVKAISMDGSSLQQYPSAIQDNGMSLNMGVKTPGALVVFDSNRNKPVVLGYGYMHYTEIFKRIHTLFVSGTADPDTYLKQNIVVPLDKYNNNNGSY